MGDEKKPDPSAGGAAPPADPPTPPTPPTDDGAPPTPPTGQAYATFPTQAAFDERLERATRAKLRELGVDPEQAKKDAAELAEMKAAEATRRAEQMSELEKAQADAETAKVAVAEAEAKAAASQKTAETAQLAAAHQVSDLRYLEFRLGDCAAEDDRDEWLTKLLEDPVERTRFGLDAAPTSKPKATTTSTPKAGGAPAPSAGGGAPDGEKTAMKMTRAEFEAHKRAKYGGGGQGIRKGFKPPPS